MKQLQITTVIPAIVLPISLFQPHNKLTNSDFIHVNTDQTSTMSVLSTSLFAKSQSYYISDWFKYASGDPADPSNYRPVFENPNCIGSDVLCAIYITMDWSTFRPDAAALHALYLESSAFTNPGSYVDGIVSFKSRD